MGKNFKSNKVIEIARELGIQIESSKGANKASYENEIMVGV